MQGAAAELVSGNRAKAKLAKGDFAFGTWIWDFRNIAILKTVADAGFDFVYIDMEHTSISWQTVGDLCFTAKLLGLAPIVRPAELTAATTIRLLDMGALGIMFHDVDDLDEVEEIRGWISGVKGARGQKFSIPPDFAFVIQIETEAGMANLEQIIGAGGIDIVEIGRGDLASAMGFDGDRDHPKVREAIDRIISVCQKNGVAAGVTCLSKKEIPTLVKRGVRCLTYSGDRRLLADALQEGMALFKHETAATK